MVYGGYYSLPQAVKSYSSLNVEINMFETLRTMFVILGSTIKIKE